MYAKKNVRLSTVLLILTAWAGFTYWAVTTDKPSAGYMGGN